MTGRPWWGALVAMDALLAHHREHARQLDPADKLRQGLSPRPSWHWSQFADPTVQSLRGGATRAVYRDIIGV